MFAITNIDLLIADPILSAQLRFLANELLMPFRSLRSNYWINVEMSNNNMYVRANNGIQMSKKLKCSNQTKHKILNLR